MFYNDTTPLGRTQKDKSYLILQLSNQPNRISTDALKAAVREEVLL